MGAIEAILLFVMKRSDDRNGSNGEIRLESWKLIAAYLNRDVRTVRRWEQQERLPVHRHQHRKRGTVYAYTAEIDAWLNSRSSNYNGDVPAATGSRLARLSVFAGAALVLVAAGAIRILPPATEPVVESISILIPESDNRSGETRFDGTIDGYLRGELGSPQRLIVPPNQISAGLRLMRQPGNRTLDRSLASELARRSATIDLIAASTLERFGGAYLLTVELMEAADGATVATVRSEAASENDFSAALRNLTDLTLAAIEDAELPDRPWHAFLDPVTTSSTAAAELYSDATLLMYNPPSQLNAAAEGLRRAIELDPEFASAYVQLAHAIQEQGGAATAYLPLAERAVELAASVSEPERLFIVGSYHKLKGELDVAHPQLFTLAETYPQHFWGQVQMAELSHALGNLEGAAWSMALAADLRPKALGFQMTAFNFILTTPHTWNAERIRDRLIELNPPAENGGVHPFMPAEFYDVNQLILDGNAPAILAELNAMRRKLDGFPEDVWTKRSGYAARLAEYYIAVGRLRDAEELLQIMLDDDADEGGNTPLIRTVAEQQLRSLLAVSRNEPCCDAAREPGLLYPDAMILSVRSRLLDAGSERLTGILQRDLPQAQMLRAELARQEGDAALAIERLTGILDAELDRLRTLGRSPGIAMPTSRLYFLAAASLADILLAEGQTDAAMRVLARWSNEQSRVAAFMSSPAFGPYWTDLRWRLARLYVDEGQSGPAAAILDYLGRLLALADEDHFIAGQLRG